ncbi:MAG TPA: RDD family protein [Candidatus Binatia bacterium]|nr:RDD family protein [Candidatus Binatia bacterium]
MEERIQITTPDHVMLEFELAGPGSRFSAYAIDFVLNVLLIAAIVVLAYLTSGLMIVRALATPWGGQPSISWLAGVVILIIFATNWGYYVFFEGFGKGSTPGKKRIGIRVIRDDGLPVGLREAALRNLVRAADMLPPPSYILGGLVMHFDRRGRRLGDMVAGTYVVVEKFDFTAPASGGGWAKRVEQGRSRQAVTLPRGSISAQQLGLIEQYLARSRYLADDRRGQLAWQIAEPLLPLLEQDRESLAHAADRTERCERLLLGLLDLARQKTIAVPARSPGAKPRPLF